VLKATGARVETGFSPSFGYEQASAGKPVTTYFRKELYPRAQGIEDFPAFGQIDRSKISASNSDGDLFTIVLTPKEALP
jgi:hypothetical protein